MTQMAQIKELTERSIGAELRTALTFDDILLVLTYAGRTPAWPA